MTGFSSKGCIVKDTVTVTNPPILSTTSLPESAMVCPEEPYLADPGAGWTNITWTSGNGFNGSGRNIELTGPCKYYLSGYSSKGCLVRDTIIVLNYNVTNETALPEEMTVCAGQVYKADPGAPLNNVTWWSDNGYASAGQIAEISTEGYYYMTGYTNRGCSVSDTIRLYVSANLLDANFLMMSEAYAGDTVVIIEVSWPVPDNLVWELPESASVRNVNNAVKEVIFNTPGTYYIELTANLATCSSIRGKYIEILDNEPDKSAGDKTDELSGSIRNFNVFPNPASDNLNMKVELAEETDIRVELISINGSKLSDIVQGYAMSSYDLSIDVSQLDPGMYMIRLIAGNQVKTKMLIVR